MVLGVDLDNVIARTDPKVREIARQLFGVRLRRQDIVEFEYHRCGLTRDQERRVFEVFNAGACTQLALMPGARRALNHLAQIYGIHIVTSRDASTVEMTRDWLVRKGIPFDDLIHTAVKGSERLSLDHLIEDRWEYALRQAELGVQVLLFSHPWNSGKGDHPRIGVVGSWGEILEVLG